MFKSFLHACSQIIPYGLSFHGEAQCGQQSTLHLKPTCAIPHDPPSSSWYCVRLPCSTELTFNLPISGFLRWRLCWVPLGGLHNSSAQQPLWFASVHSFRGFFIKLIAYSGGQSSPWKVAAFLHFQSRQQPKAKICNSSSFWSILLQRSNIWYPC